MPGSSPGMTSQNLRSLVLLVPLQATVGEFVDDTLVDIAERSGGSRHDAQMRDQCAGDSAMCNRDRVAIDARVPIADAKQQLGIALSAGRNEIPFVLLARGD